MTVHCLEHPSEPLLAGALERFERQFDYPLGPQARFRISHGRDYLPFFRAMGNARVLLVEQSGEVLGTLAHIERQFEASAHDQRLAHYLCDLKIAPSARGGRVLASLFREARARIARSPSHACYSVVMTGTGRLPTDYTGRIGVPDFPKVADVMVLRVSAYAGASPQIAESTDRVSSAGIRVSGGDRSLRSLMPPEKIAVHGAHGWLEDTRRGKRLWNLNGEELLNAHLSDVHFETAKAARELLVQALDRALAAGFTGVFFALPNTLWQSVKDSFAGFVITEAPAAIYGYDLPQGESWWINTAEI
jgi:hypothetical protein